MKVIQEIIGAVFLFLTLASTSVFAADGFTIDDVNMRA